MKGLEISRLFYNDYLSPMLRERFPSELWMIASGLAGPGSECYGYDDEYSKDHDFGPGVCVWIPRREAERLGPALKAAYDMLPKSIPECDLSPAILERSERIGVQTVEGFYEKLIGLPRAPETNFEWLRVPSMNFSQACNGAVFLDPLGEFTEIRNAIISFFPEDVLKKKLAANCAWMAQAGQYNYPRSVSREDTGAAYLSLAEFIKHTLAVLYLLNGKFMPYYKWAFRGTEEFKHLSGCSLQLKKLLSMSDETQAEDKQKIIEDICASVSKELIIRGLTEDGDDFMQYHAQKITESITDDRLRALPIMYGGE